MANWSTEPALTQTWANFLASLKERDEHLAKMDFTGDTNLPTTTIRWNNSAGAFERWNGSSWTTMPVANSTQVPPNSRIINAGSGLTGGGSLAADRTISMANMSAGTVKGRASGAGAGAPTDLSVAQLIAILNAGSALDADTVDGQHASAFAALSHTHAASSIVSGTFSNSRIAQSNVTQYQAALSILETQIQNGSIFPRLASAETVSGLWNYTTRPTLAGVGLATLNEIATSERLMKTANQGVTSTTFVNDSHLANFSLAANTRYVIHGNLICQRLAGNAEDAKVSLSFTQTPLDTGDWGFIGTDQAGSQLGDVADNVTATLILDLLSATTYITHFHMSGWFRTNASVGGTVTLQIGKLTGTTQINFLEGSWLEFFPGAS